MNKIKELLCKLLNASGEEEQVKILQDINGCFLFRYMIEITPELRLYPIEVEAYYHHKHFPDTCVHQSPLQKNRFGKLYFHRALKNENAIKYKRGGFDVCLSDSNDYYFGILIRSAWLNSEEKPICGPELLIRRLTEFLCQNNAINKLSEREKSELRKLEDQELIIVNAIDDRREKGSPLFHSTRIGISKKHKEYCAYKLRSLIELKEPNHPFKEKEKVIELYMRDNAILPTGENVKQLLGYVSNSIIKELKNS